MARHEKRATPTTIAIDIAELCLNKHFIDRLIEKNFDVTDVSLQHGFVIMNFSFFFCYRFYQSHY
jgi:hypothetical protein